jgi:hypothetical protein
MRQAVRENMNMNAKLDFRFHPKYENDNYRGAIVASLNFLLEHGMRKVFIEDLAALMQKFEGVNPNEDNLKMVVVCYMADCQENNLKCHIEGFNTVAGYAVEIIP